MAFPQYPFVWDDNLFREVPREQAPAPAPPALPTRAESIHNILLWLANLTDAGVSDFHEMPALPAPPPLNAPLAEFGWENVPDDRIVNFRESLGAASPVPAPSETMSDIRRRFSPDSPPFRVDTPDRYYEMDHYDLPAPEIPINNIAVASPELSNSDHSDNSEQPLSASDIRRADIIGGVMLYAIRDGSSPWNDRRVPEALAGSYNGFDNALEEFWRTHRIRNFLWPQLPPFEQRRLARLDRRGLLHTWGRELQRELARGTELPRGRG